MEQARLREFLLAHGLPSAGHLSAETSLDEYCNGDRLLRFQVLRPILDRGSSCPEELISSVRTLGDVLAWAQDTSVGGPGSKQRPLPTRSILAASPGDWPLASSRIRLRPIRPTDLDLLYESVNGLHTGLRWPTHGRSVGFGELEGALRQQALMQQVAERTDDYRPVGFYTLASSSEPDQRAELSVYGLQSSGSNRAGTSPLQVLEGFALFISCVFKLFAYRKLVAEIPGWNWGQFASGEGAFFRVEGELIDHDYLDGRWWTRRLIAITRVDWEELEPGLAASVGELRPDGRAG